MVFSASLDSSIRIWALPENSRDPYGAYDPSTSVQTLIGHTEAIWDLRLLPSRASPAAPRLVSCSADGSVRLWARNGKTGQWTLDSTINDFPQGVVPTCLGVYHADYTRLLVGFSNGLIGLYDVDTRRQVATMGCKWSYPRTKGDRKTDEDLAPDQKSQVNSVMSHPSSSLVVGGYEDGYLRTFNSEKCKLRPYHPGSWT